MESQSSTLRHPSIPSSETPTSSTTSDKSDENSALKFYETIPSLQEIASYVIALESWRQVFNNENPKRKGEMDDDGNEFTFLEEEDVAKVMKIIDQFPFPQPIRDLLEKCVEFVRIEINNWAYIYWGDIFMPRGKIRICDLIYCHWLPNGKIDHNRSARNMLLNTRLKLTNRFDIMCKYCFEDEIKKFPVELIPEFFIEDAYRDFYNNPLVFYWLCYLKVDNKDLSEVPIRDDERLETDMIHRATDYTWSAVEYFWNRLNVDEQTAFLEQTLETLDGDFNFQKSLFFKLSESQKIRVLSKFPIQIMKNFWKQHGEESFALQTWIYVSNFIDSDQFEQMWKALAPSNTEWDIDEKIRCLMVIWNHCPDHLKKLAYQPAILDEIMKFFYVRNFRRHRCDNIEFLRAFLCYASPESRKKIIFRVASALVSNLDFSITPQLIALCLPDADDVVLFKKQILGSTFILNCLCDTLRNRQLNKVNEFLSYFCPDSSTRSEFCRRMLELIPVDVTKLREPSKCFDVLIEFIDKNLLPTSPDRALKFKKRIVLCEGFCWQFLSSPEEMTKMIQLVSKVLHFEELLKVKTKLLEEIPTKVQWHSFDEEIIPRFISWCCNNDRRKEAEFKKNVLSIDDIFEQVWKTMKSNKVLQASVDRETMLKLFNPLDKFLLWYLEKPENVKWFKLKKVFGCYSYAKKASMVVFADENDDIFTKNTLPWFFEGDRGAIEFFKNMYKDEAIGQMI